MPDKKCQLQYLVTMTWIITLLNWESYQTRPAANQRVQHIPRNMHTVLLCFCFVVVMQSFIMNSHEVFIHIHQGCFAGTGAMVRLPQCQWSKPDGYGKISQCITTTKHSKAVTVCIFLGIYCNTGVIAQSNIITYYINNYINWSKISIRCWLRKRHNIPRPNRQAMGCLLWIFVRKLTTL